MMRCLPTSSVDGKPFCPGKLYVRVYASGWSILFLLLISLICSIEASAQRPTDFDVKAAYLYNFAKYVRWPAHEPANFEICVLGNDPFGTALDQIARGEKIGGEELAVRRLQSPAEAFGCRILFLGNSENKRLVQDMALLSARPILTVSDIGNFASQGGTIQFVNDDGRVRFIINRSAAEKSGLALSSELLKVAKSVLPPGSTGRE